VVIVPPVVVAVSVAVPVTQIIPLLPAIAVGVALTVTVVVDWLVQPEADVPSVTVNVYTFVPTDVGAAVAVAEVPPLTMLAPLQV